MLFWIITVAITLVAIVWVVFPLLRPKTGTVTRSAYDVQIYKDQLKEVESDLARGTLSGEEAKASRTEVSRRLLAAADAEAREKISGNAPKTASRALAALVTLTVVGGGVALYYTTGAFGYPDQPFATRQAIADTRPTQADAEEMAAQARAAGDSLPDIQQPDAQHVALVQRLLEVLKDRPDDLQGHRMLADNLAQLGRYVDARNAQANVMRLLGDDATADDYAAYAEILIVAAGYYVSPEAEDALGKTLQMEPQNPRALYYAGMAMLQQGRADMTYQIWEQLLQNSPPDAPWVAVIESQMDAVAAEAGIARTTAPGPTADDIAAASDMNEEDRADLVRSMVSRLSERLATEGGTPDEWARLISAHGVLGDTEKAGEIWTEAQGVFASDTAALEAVKQGAISAGLVQE